MDLNELEEAFPGSRSLALSEQRANKTHRGEQKKKNTMMPHKLIRFQTEPPRTLRGVFSVLLVACLALPRTQAVVPAPDGGYPGSNTAKGQGRSKASRPAFGIPPLVFIAL